MTLLNDILSQVTTSTITNAISNKAGTKESQTKSILEQALPALLGGMATQTQSKSGAKSLLSALDKDHDGSILDDLANIAKHPQSGKGSGILKHVLGENLEGFESLLGKNAGTDKSTVNTVLELAAPLLMGALGKEKQNQGLNAKSLASELLSAKGEIQGKSDLNPLLSLLDKDGDGDIKDEAAAFGLSFLKKEFFG